MSNFWRGCGGVMTDEEIWKCASDYVAYWDKDAWPVTVLFAESDMLRFARAIETATHEECADECAELIMSIK